LQQFSIKQMLKTVKSVIQVEILDILNAQ